MRTYSNKGDRIALRSAGNYSKSQKKKEEKKKNEARRRGNSMGTFDRGRWLFRVSGNNRSRGRRNEIISGSIAVQAINFRSPRRTLRFLAYRCGIPTNGREREERKREKGKKRNNARTWTRNGIACEQRHVRAGDPIKYPSTIKIIRATTPLFEPLVRRLFRFD